MISQKHLLGITIGLLPIVNATSAQAASLSLNLSSNPITIGQPLTVDIVVSDLGNNGPPSVSAFDLDVDFDPSTLAYSGGTFGNLLGDPNDPLQVSTATITPSANSINLVELSELFASEAQCIDLGGPPAFCSVAGPFLDDLQSDSFTLASLTFNTIGAGTSNLTLSVNPNGLLDADLPPQTLLTEGVADNPSLTVLPSGSASVPEPSFTNTFIFLALGLTWGIFRQQKN